MQINRPAGRRSISTGGRGIAQIHRDGTLDRAGKYADHCATEPVSTPVTVNRASPPPLPAWHVAATHTCVLIALMLCTHGSRADDDTVNERPSATGEQRERHWGVDCATLRSDVLAASADPLRQQDAVAGEAARRAAEWIKGLRLCAAIYNVPGDAAALRCPDYAGAARALADAGPAQRDDLRKLLQCAQ